jgi:hypothetical protein
MFFIHFFCLKEKIQKYDEDKEIKNLLVKTHILMMLCPENTHHQILNIGQYHNLSLQSVRNNYQNLLLLLAINAEVQR